MMRALLPFFFLIDLLVASDSNTTFMNDTQEMLKSVWSALHTPFFTINGSPISVSKIVFSLLFFIIGMYIGSFYKKSIHTFVHARKSFNPSSRTIVVNIGYYAIVLSSFFVALNILGINLSSIALIAGALSVGIGFGLQNIVSNFVSGLILMFERSIKIGDYLELSDQLRGHVTDIRMRSTTINTNSNIDVIVPNQDLIQKQVINWTMNDEIRRFSIGFGVAYGTSPKHVIDVILDAVKKEHYPDVYEKDSHSTRVFMTKMNDSSVDFELHIWITGKEIFNQKSTHSRFLILIYDTLYANDIKIPFPQRDIHIYDHEKEESTL